MKKVTALFLALVFAATLLAQVPGVGIPGTPVQQANQMLNAGVKTTSNSGAVATQFTVTATPAGSNYVYITGIDMSFCQDATGVASTNVNFQFTAGIAGNLNGAVNTTTLPVWSTSAPLTVDVCVFKSVNFPMPLKGISPGTAVSLQSPASSTHTAYSINIYWYEAQ